MGDSKTTEQQDSRDGKIKPYSTPSRVDAQHYVVLFSLFDVSW